MKKINIAIILSAGKGARFNSTGLPKQLAKLSGNPVISYTIKQFQMHPLINEIIIVGDKKHIEKYNEIVESNHFDKVSRIIIGGESRKESSWAGLASIEPNKNKKINVLIHDAVRPFVSGRIITDIIKALDKYKAVDVAIPLADTLIHINKNKTIKEIPPREEYHRGQTPQGFHLNTIIKAHRMAHSDNFTTVTDDCGLILKYNLGEVYVVEGDEENIKITYPLDLHIADKLFQLHSINLDGKNLEDKLTNKSIMIFGHSSGIGKEIFSISSKLTNKVIGFSKSSGYNLIKPGVISKALKQYRKEYGPIDVLISTVGILKSGNLNKISFDDISEQISTNLTSQINLVKESIPFMAENSSIILFTSSSYTRGRMGYSVYSASKAALVNFVQAMAEELEPLKIKINAICPARTLTPLRLKNFNNEDPSTLLDPRKVALVTLNSISENITGQIINVNK